MTNELPNESNEESGRKTGQLKYDLEERTATFSEHVIDFASTIKQNAVTLPLISQLVRAATSIGANYCEADDAESKRTFATKLVYVARRLAKQNIGFGCLLVPHQIANRPLANFGKKRKSCTLFFHRFAGRQKNNQLTTAIDG